MRKNIALALSLLIVGLLSLVGCRNAMQPQDIPESAAETGSLSLTIGYGRARTIQPVITGINDFDVFSLYLAHENSVNNIHIQDWNGTPVRNMAVGGWTLTVTAYLPNPIGDYVEAARTGVPVPFEVIAGETTTLSVVELLPIPYGTGWFSWNLTFPGGIASIRVTDLLSGDSVGDAFVFPGSPDNLELPAGRYRAHLVLNHDGEEVTISRILNIYAGMTSPWAEAFTVDDFNRPFLNYFLESWNGSWWDLWWVQPGHFDILRAEEGIQGVYPYNFWTIHSQFNNIHRLPWHPGYNTADCLRVLVDAALIATGVQQGTMGQPCCCNETAIRDWVVRNGTDITFVREWDWWDITFPWGWSIPWQWWGYETVAIIGNYYIVGIWQPQPVDPRCECNPYLCCCDTPHFPSCHCGSHCWCSEHNVWCMWPPCSPCRCDNCWCDNHCSCGRDNIMLPIQGGTFLMGYCPSGESVTPMRYVTVSSFHMSRFQVTQGEWYDVMGSNPSYFNRWHSAIVAADINWRDLPVETVSWYDAIVFSNRLSIQRGLTPAYSIDGSTNPYDWGPVPTGSNATWNAVVVVPGSTGYRLPTEAQWEFAARGGIVCQGNYAFSGSDTASDVAWLSGNSGSRTHEVGTRQPNALGLYDMSGNVFEWVWDWFDTYPNFPETDPTGPAASDNRVVRGGSWAVPPGSARSAVRPNASPDGRSTIIGFRVVRP